MTDLQKKNNDKEFKLDELEQYDRRQNLEFAQVPYHEGENVTQIVLDLDSKLEVKLDNEDISIAHRLPQKKRSATNNGGSQKSAHPAIIARFVSRDKRNKLYENRFKAKDIDDFPFDGMTELYMNENLTQRRKRLFWRSKQQAKELSYIWTNNGQINDIKLDDPKLRECAHFILCFVTLGCRPHSSGFLWLWQLVRSLKKVG